MTLFIITQNSVNAEVNICVKYARNADWFNVLIKCQDRANTGNDPIAAYILGYMYQKGVYVSSDLVRSVEWYKLSSTNGNSQAKINLGIMLMKGQGVKNPDKGKGMFLIKEAAKMGHKSAIALLNQVEKHDLKNLSNHTYQLKDYLYILNDY